MISLSILNLCELTIKAAGENRGSGNICISITFYPYSRSSAKHGVVSKFFCISFYPEIVDICVHAKMCDVRNLIDLTEWDEPSKEALHEEPEDSVVATNFEVPYDPFDLMEKEACIKVRLGCMPLGYPIGCKKGLPVVFIFVQLTKNSIVPNFRA